MVKLYLLNRTIYFIHVLKFARKILFFFSKSEINHIICMEKLLFGEKINILISVNKLYWIFIKYKLRIILVVINSFIINVV